VKKLSKQFVLYHSSIHLQSHSQNLMSDLNEHLASLDEINELLATDPTNDEYLQIKNDLLELIEITKEELDSEPEPELTTQQQIPDAIPSFLEKTSASAAAWKSTAADELSNLYSDSAPSTNIINTYPATSSTQAAEPTPIEKNKKKSNITADSTFVIPDNLKLLPTDTEEAKLKKRKKVKGLKQKFKATQSDVVQKEGVASWQDFKTGGKKKKKRKGVTDIESQFTTKDLTNHSNMTEFDNSRKKFKL